MEGKHAYVTLVYGSGGGYAAGAAVLGHSLAKTGTRHDRVLLHTPDVPKKHVRVLSQLFNVVKQIDYVKTDPALIKDFDRSHFKGTFTKFHVFALTEYDKVLFLDADVCVLRSLDGLFALDAPAAVPIIEGDFAIGERLAKELFYYPNGGAHRHDVNTGLMLLAPSAELFLRFTRDVAEPKPRASGYKFAEQGYLTEQLAGEWRFVPHWYNFQFHLRRDRGLEEKYAFEHLAERVHALHYSALVPWVFLSPQTDPVALRRYVDDAPAMTIWLRMFYELRLDFLERYGFDLLTLAP
jgi:hypothetical protein